MPATQSGGLPTELACPGTVSLSRPSVHALPTLRPEISRGRLHTGDVWKSAAQIAGYGASGIVPETAVLCTGGHIGWAPCRATVAAELVSQIETSKERKLG